MRNIDIWMITLLVLILSFLGIYQFGMLGAVVNPTAFIVSTGLILLLLIVVIFAAIKRKNKKRK